MNTNEFRVIISGAKEFDDYELLKEKCDYYLSRKAADPTCKIIIMCGHEPGAEVLGERYALEKKYELDLYIPNRGKNGKSAVFIRNKQMAKVANCAIIFKSAYGNNFPAEALEKCVRWFHLLVRVVEEEA